jgi:hypothetical protein
VRGNANAYIEMMTVHLDAPVTQLVPPDDAAARKKAFAGRNLPEQVKKLADQLFAIWDWDQKGSSRMAITRRLNTGKAEITELYQQGKYQAALDAFRAYFFAKVLLLWDDEKGLVSRDFEGRFGRDFTIQNYEGNVTLLMDNVYQARSSKETVHLGEMGALRWDWEPGGLQNPWYTPEVFEYFASEPNFHKLWWKFVDTGDRQYLDKYLAYYEDYTLNYRFQENLNPLNLDYGKQGHGNCEHFIHAISEIARVLPPGGDGFPSTTLARILIRQLTVTVPQSVYYNREQSGNHSCGAVHVHQYLSSFLYDFKIARLLEHESRRQFEIYNALVDLPDGSMYGRSAGYSRHEFTENSTYVNKIKKADLDWLTPSEELEFQERLADRVFWYFNLFDASGEHVNGVSGGRRNMDFSGRVNLIAKFQPQALRNPALQAVAVAILRNQTGPDWTGTVHANPDNPLLQGGLNAQEPPPYTSISFPYNHISIMRSGWDMNEDQTGAFLHSSEQGLNGGLFLRGKNCNSLTVSAFNQALLVNGIEYAYNYVRSPIQVDGQDQFARAGITGHARKGEHDPGLVRISPWRNHHSAAFDVAEGNYDGIYSESPDHEPILYHYETNLSVLKGALQGEISHHRIVQFVKESGVWFVLDIMEADRPRTYRQQWWMSKLTEKNPDGYRQEWVSADADRGMFYSHADSMTNMSMYHVGPVLLGAGAQSMSYNPVSTYIKQEEWYKGFRADRKQGVEFLHLTTDWHSEAGRSQLITVIYPRRQGQPEEDLQVERADNGREVTVTTKNGDRMHFVADGLESTLTVHNAGENIERGLVLTQFESYEITRDGKSEDRVPIYRPIGELVIRPNVSVFADEIAVSMRAAENDVVIRYTTDGSDPTLQSPLYSGGLVLSASTTLKARGFRKGLKKMPVNRAGNTLMSRVYRASYIKDPAHEGLPDELTGKLKRGLKYSYYEDKWPKLLFGAPLTAAIKTGTVDSAFDTSPGSGKEDQAFAFRYEGYFKAPEDGVYTLFAPAEFYKYNPLAGYDLDVHLGYQRRWHQGVKAQVGPDTPLQQWYPGTRRHALGTWSVFLKKGYHPIRIYFADIRPGGYLEYMHFKYDGVNVPGLIKRYWDGDVPELEIAGPGIQRGLLPREYLYH